MANSSAFTAPVTYNDQQIKDAIAAAKAQGYTDAQIAQGAAANFGVSPDRISSLMAPAPAGSFTTPSWVANAKQTIGTGVVPVYPMRTVHGGGQAEDTSAAPIGYKYDNGKSEYVYLDLAGKPTGKVENRGTGLLGNVTDMAKTVAPLALAALGANYLPGLLGAEGGGGLLEAAVGGGGAGTSIGEMVASGLAPGSAGAYGAASGLLTGDALAAAAGLSGTAATTLASTLGTGAGTSINEMIASGTAPGSVGAQGAASGALTGDALAAAQGVGTGGLLTTIPPVVPPAVEPTVLPPVDITTPALVPPIVPSVVPPVVVPTGIPPIIPVPLGVSPTATPGTSPPPDVGPPGTNVPPATTDTNLLTLIQSLLKGGAGLLQGNSAKEAAQIQADAITAAAKTAADAAKFKPVGVTTAFGKSNFGYDANGNLISAGYELPPELAAQRDAILKAAGTTGMDWMKNTQTAGQGLFNLGQGYVAKTPEEAAAEWMAAQQKVLQPAQDTAYARMQQNLANTGRGGLSIAQGTGMGAANPEAQAYYNALAQQNNQLAASAQAEGRAATTFGQGLMTGGLDLVSQGYNPYKTQFGTAQSVEQAGQNALDIGSALGGRAATAGANAGQTLYQGGVNAANVSAPANAYNPYASLLAGAAGNPTITDYLNKWITGV